MSLDDLAEHCDLPEKETLLSGELTYRQLDKVGEYFGYYANFFQEKEALNDKNVHSPEYRALAAMAGPPSAALSKIIRKAEEHRDIHLWMREDLHEPVQKISLPNIHVLPDWQRKAAALREWLGLEVPTDSVQTRTFEAYRRAVEKKGVLVFMSVADEHRKTAHGPYRGIKMVSWR